MTKALTDEIDRRRQRELELVRKRRNVLGGFRNAELRQNPERNARLAAEVNAEGPRGGRVKQIAEREGLSKSRVYAIAKAHGRHLAKPKKRQRTPTATARALAADRRLLTAVVEKIQRLATGKAFSESFPHAMAGWQESEILEGIRLLYEFCSALENSAREK